jgi:hypothetical protein
VGACFLGALASDEYYLRSLVPFAAKSFRGLFCSRCANSKRLGQRRANASLPIRSLTKRGICITASSIRPCQIWTRHRRNSNKRSCVSH